MKLGINISIDVTKIDKTRLFAGKKGTYLDVTTFVDTENKDQYENNGFITQSTTKEEREAGVQLPILGNVGVFYSDQQSNAPQVQQQPSHQPQQAVQQQDQPFEDDLDVPF